MPKKKSEPTKTRTSPFKLKHELVIGKLSDQKDVEYLTTGVAELDTLLGGFARGRITEIYGKQSVGKSHLAGLMVSKLSQEHDVLYIDAEFSVDKRRLEQLGADTKKVSYVADAQLEKVGELVLAEVDKWDVIIIDSLAVLTPLTIDTNHIGENAIGLFARLIKHWVVKLRPRLSGTKTALVVLNQFRKPIGSYIAAEPPGGMAWFHACDVRLELYRNNSSDVVLKGSKPVGHNVHVKVIKNKLGAPGGTTQFFVTYGEINGSGK